MPLKPRAPSSADAVAGGDPVFGAHLAPDGLVVGAGLGDVGAAGAEAASEGGPPSSGRRLRGLVRSVA
jgi:hypothetical protein